MAVNKNFVVKNGFEVDTNLIYADALTDRVGIGLTVPQYTLDVSGGIGATDLRITGVTTVLKDLRVGTSGTIFSVVTSSQSIGIGTALPAYLLDVRSPVSTGQTALYVQGDVRITGDLYVDDIEFNDATVSNLTITDSLFVGGSPGVSTFVGFTTFQDYVYIQDGLNVSGVTTLGTVKVSSGIITATSGVVTYYGDGQYLNLSNSSYRGIGIGTTGGLVGYGITFLSLKGAGVSTTQYNSSVGIATIFFEGGGSGTIGIGSTFPSSSDNGDLFYHIDYGRTFVYYDEVALGVGSSAFWVDSAPFNVGIITSLTNVSFAPGTASDPSMYFVGDDQTGFFSPSLGQQTFVSSGSSILNINSKGINVTGIITSSSVSTGNINSSGVITATTFNGNIIGAAATFTGNVSIAGTLTYEDVTNVDSIGLITARTGVKVTTGGVDIANGGFNVNAGVSTFAGITTHTASLFGTQASFTGVVTASSFRGDGSQLTGVSAGLSLQQAESVIAGGAATTVNFASGATITNVSAGIATITIAAGIQTEALVASGIVTTLNLSKQDHKVTVSGITTITVSGGTEGDSHTVRIVNSGIATVGFSTYFLFPSGSPPVLPTTSGAISIVSFTVHRVGTAGTQLLAGASLNFS